MLTFDHLDVGTRRVFLPLFEARMAGRTRRRTDAGPATRHLPMVLASTASLSFSAALTLNPRFTAIVAAGSLRCGSAHFKLTPIVQLDVDDVSASHFSLYPGPLPAHHRMLLDLP